MNIDANTVSGPPAPAQKVAAGHHRGSGDAVADPSVMASFMALLHDLTATADEPVPSVVAGSAPLEPDREAGDASSALPSAGVAADGVVAPVPVAEGAAVPAQAHARAARAAAMGVVRSGGATADAGQARLSAAEPQQQQAWHTASDDAAGNGAEKPGTAALDTGTLFRQQPGEAAVSGREGPGRPDAESEALAKEAMQASAARPLLAPQSAATAASVVSMFEAGLAGLRAGPAGRVLDRGAARTHQLPESAKDGLLPWAEGTPGTGAAQAASPVYAPAAATPVPAAVLARKLHFWVAGGVQSAQLQLDAFDGGAVDVHIAVKGEEAYIEFRSDQPQARKLLIDAMPHLKDLLAGEGLMLSGGYVGGSAQHPGDDGSAHRERFPGARSAREQVTVDVRAPASAVRSGLGSAVDLFV